MTNLNKSTENKIGWIVASASILLLIVILFAVSGDASSNQSLSGNVVVDSDSNSAENAQVVNMYVQNDKYILEPSTFKVGIPVRIEADMSKMPGCSKSLSISAFNIRKTLTSKDNIIEFTPTKAGTFNIACSMNMYVGTFTVLEADGTKSNYAEAAPKAGTCGGASGGCGGCGGCGGGSGGCGG